MGKDFSGCRCKHFEKCLIVLNLMLDEEADKEQERFFHDHIETCMVCFGHYKVEKQIRQLLKYNVRKKQVSKELAMEIRNKILQRST